MKKTTQILASKRVVSVPINEELYKKVERHAIMQNGGNIQDCLIAAISEVVEIWEDYDSMINSIKIEEKPSLF